METTIAIIHSNKQSHESQSLVITVLAIVPSVLLKLVTENYRGDHKPNLATTLFPCSFLFPPPGVREERSLIPGDGKTRNFPLTKLIVIIAISKLTTAMVSHTVSDLNLGSR